MARVLGIGGVFIKSADPKKLSAWYRDALGIAVEEWGGAIFTRENGPERTVWSPFAKDSKYFDPSKRELMVNFAVDDLDGLLAALKTKNVTILGRDDTSDPNGKFAWILDPEGTKIELWQAT
jgi:catechol 2,3-dioxygenase-like lactoylglutathione lyase family enzyme